MATEMGEYVVGGYLKEIEMCDFVDYGVRVPGGRLKGLNELDVLGLRFKDKSAFLCEVKTHTQSLGIGSSQDETVAHVRKKYEFQQEYARARLADFQPRFMFWSPVVATGLVTKLKQLGRLELILNEDYARRVGELQKLVQRAKQDLGNLFLRALQILACVHKSPHVVKARVGAAGS